MNAIQITEPEARALADAIRQISSSQPPAEALKFIEMALARAPQHPIVLNAAASHLLQAGNPARARELYERALAIDPGAKVLWLNLAGACRSLADPQAEGAALQKALAIDPRYVLALLQKGDLMERLGNPRAAAIVFGAALDSIRPETQLPAAASSAVAHAREVVLASRRELEASLEEAAAAVREQHSGADQSRYDACRDVYLRKRSVYVSEPKEILFPYLPALEFYPREQFEWLTLLEGATEDIAAEALAALNADRSGFVPYVDFPPGAPIDQWAPLNRSMDWTVYSLWHDGVPVSEHIARCPKTAAVLEKLPMCDVPGHAPGAYFSVLKPRTRLPPHTGTTNTRLIAHLPLVVPAGCRFRVGSATRDWEKGKAWVFDDCIEHEAWNDSDQIRIILIFDTWNPFLSQAERDLVRAMTVSIGHFYGVDAPTLGSR